MLFTIFWVVLAVILFALVVTSGLFYFLKKRIYAIDLTVVVVSFTFIAMTLIGIQFHLSYLLSPSSHLVSEQAKWVGVVVYLASLVFLLVLFTFYSFFENLLLKAKNMMIHTQKN